MRDDTVAFIDDCFERSLKDPFSVTVGDMERLLSLDPDSDECAYLGSKARELANC
jgi:hypothetical protein